MKLQKRIEKLEQELQRARAELGGAYDGWNACETTSQAGLDALQDMLDEEVKKNRRLTRRLAQEISANESLRRRFKMQARTSQRQLTAARRQQIL